MVCLTSSGTGFKLTAEYEKQQKLAKKIEENKPLTPEDYLSFSSEATDFKTFITKIFHKGEELGIVVPDEVMKELKDLGIDYESDPQTKNKLKDATEEEQIDNVFKNDTNLKFSFMRKVPANLKELLEMQGDVNKLYDEVINGKMTDEDGLFESEEDDVPYEKMDSLAEIDDMPEHMFKEEEEHANKMRKEQLEEIEKIKSEGKTLREKFEEAKTSPKAFEEMMKEEPDALRSELLDDREVERTIKEFEELMEHDAFSEEAYYRQKIGSSNFKSPEQNEYYKKNRK